MDFIGFVLSVYHTDFTASICSCIYTSKLFEYHLPIFWVDDSRPHQCFQKSWSFLLDASIFPFWTYSSAALKLCTWSLFCWGCPVSRILPVLMEMFRKLGEIICYHRGSPIFCWSQHISIHHPPCYFLVTVCGAHIM